MAAPALEPTVGLHQSEPPSLLGVIEGRAAPGEGRVAVVTRSPKPTAVDVLQLVALHT
jgi:hypothetical protein